jgi:hypothetical protein
MKLTGKVLAVMVLALFSAVINPVDEWKQEKHKGYTLFYKDDDESEKARYAVFIDKGIESVKFFTKDSCRKEFKVFVHPSRAGMDKQWQADWNMSGFKSECWMVASGVATKLDLLSPLTWSKQACEHDYANKDETQKVITHELFHVYHAQLNPSTDFGETQGIDWLVEGFATYASGQCNTERLKQVKDAVASKTAPTALDDFWKGKLKYGFSGSLVMFIDQKYGRERLKDLLKFKTCAEVLGALKTGEKTLLKDWTGFIEKFEVG